jgi:hypothetical protein
VIHQKLFDKFLDTKKIPERLSGDEIANAFKQPYITRKHIEKGLNHSDPKIVSATFKSTNPLITSKDVQKGIDSRDFNTIRDAIMHPSATEGQIHMMLDFGKDFGSDKSVYDKTAQIREAAIKNPSATVRNLDKAMKDPSSSVRSSAVAHKNATEEHLEMALNDKDPSVTADAISSHKKVRPEHMIGALNDAMEKSRGGASRKDYKSIAIAVARNKKTPSDILNHPFIQQNIGDHYVAMVLAKNPNTPSETLEKLSKHSLKEISRPAVVNLSNRKSK